MTALLYSLLLLLYITTIQCDETGKVHVLTDKTFNDYISTGNHLIEFYAPWCQHCKSLQPTYELAAAQTDSKVLQYSKVDCTVNKNVCNSQNIQGYPTIKYKSGNSNELVEYNSGRELDDFKRFSHYVQQPAIQTIIDQKDINTLLSDNSVVFVLFNDGKANPVFDNVAYRYHAVTKYKFATAPLHLLNKYKTNDNNVLNDKLLAISNGRTLYPSLQFGNSITTEDVINFIENNKFTLINTLDNISFSDIVKTNKYIVIVVTDHSNNVKQAQCQAYVNTLYNIAEKHSDKYVMLELEAYKYGGYLAAFGINKSVNLPNVFVVEYPTYYYKITQIVQYSNLTTAPTPDQLDTFLTAVINNQLPSYSVEPWYHPQRYLTALRYYYNQQTTYTQYAILAGGLSCGLFAVYVIGKNIYKTFKEEWDNMDDDKGKKQQQKQKQTPAQQKKEQ